MDNLNRKQKWGFLRETKRMAEKAGIDGTFGLHRTGLEDYLAVIFPGKEWIHDRKCIDGQRIRPDYRCEELKLIVEFDGTKHYKDPKRIAADRENEEKYEGAGYKVIRIPYFIQLTNEAVKTMFGVDVEEPLFDPAIPSLQSESENTPAFCCPEGLKRMAREFYKYPQQYAVNVAAMEKEDNEALTGVGLLKEAYNRENALDERLKMANMVAEIVQDEYGWRYDKCFNMVLMSAWFRDNRLTVDEIAQTTPNEVYSIVKRQIESRELI